MWPLWPLSHLDLKPRSMALGLCTLSQCGDDLWQVIRKTLEGFEVLQSGHHILLRDIQAHGVTFTLCKGQWLLGITSSQCGTHLWMEGGGEGRINRMINSSVQYNQDIQNDCELLKTDSSYVSKFSLKWQMFCICILLCLKLVNENISCPWEHNCHS